MKKLLYLFAAIFCVTMQAAEGPDCSGWRWCNENAKDKRVAIEHSCTNGLLHVVDVVYLNRLNVSCATCSVSTKRFDAGKGEVEITFHSSDKREEWPWDDARNFLKKRIGHCIPAKMVAEHLALAKEK